MKKIQIISEVVRELIANKLSNIFPYNLTGACALSSYILFLCLKRNGYKTRFVIGKCFGDNHCWVELNQSIIDLTATQFNLFDKVHITKINDKNYLANKKKYQKMYFYYLPNY